MNVRLALTLSLFPVYAFAQKQGVSLTDSLLHELRVLKADTNKVNVLDRLSYIYSTNNPDSGILFGRQALALSEQLQWKQGIAVSHADLGINYQAKSEHTKAIEHNLSALALYVKLKQPQSVSAIYTNLAMVYQSQSNYARALDYNLRALKIAEETHEQRTKAIILENIGSLYLEQKDYKHTVKYYSEAINIYQAINDKAGQARNLTNMGIVLDAEGKYKQAIDNHLKALEIISILGNKNSEQISYANIAIAYSHMGMLQAALQYHIKALNISKEMGSKSSIAINSGNIGETYYEIAREIEKRVPGSDSVLFNVKNAITYLHRAVSICREINFLAPAAEFLSYLSEAYYLSGNHRNAYLNYKDYTALKDSLNSNQSIINFENLEHKRELEVMEKDNLIKDKQIRIAKLELKEKKNERTLYTLGIVLLLLCLAITVYTISLYRRSNRLLSVENRKRRNLILEQLRDIKIRNKMLEDMAHKQAHDIRGKVTTIMGLSQLFNKKDYTDPNNQVVIDGIIESITKLDKTLTEIIREENEATK